MNNFYTADDMFLLNQAKKGQRRALWKNSVILGILLLCYNIFVEASAYTYSLVYYIFATGKLTFRLSVAGEYISENIENISITEYEMLGNAYVTFVSLIGMLIISRLIFKIKISELFRCEKSSIVLGFKAFPFSMVLNYTFSVIIAMITAYFASYGVVIPEAEFTVDKPTFLAGFSMFLYMVVLAPIIEEIVYRGFVVKLISPYGKTVAIVLSAFIFGLMHGNLSQFVTAFATGLVYTTIAVKANSIAPTIIMHMLNNGINFIAIAGEDYDSEVLTVIYLMLFAAVLLLGIMSIFIHRNIIKNRPQETSLLSAKESAKAIILNPAMLLYFAYLIYCFIEGIVSANIG